MLRICLVAVIPPGDKWTDIRRVKYLARWISSLLVFGSFFYIEVRAGIFG